MTFYLLRSCGAFALARRLTRKYLRILCYHGFSLSDEHESSPYMFMRAETFERRMRILARNKMMVIPLGDAVRKLKAGEIRHAETVITFDDGWATTRTIGVPLLKKYGYPASTYVTTQHLSGSPEVFNVALHYIIQRTERATLTLSAIHPLIDGTYELSKDRLAVVSTLIRLSERTYTLNERSSLLRLIARRLDMDPEEVFKDGRFTLLSAREIAQLFEDGMDVELHTHTHRLPEEPFDAVAAEIQLNQAALLPIIRKAPVHFCYPSGKFSAEHPRWLEKLGIKSATTCICGLNDQKTSPFLLKRYLDSESASDIEFEAEVVGLTEILRRLRARFLHSRFTG